MGGEHLLLSNRTAFLDASSIYLRFTRYPH